MENITPDAIFTVKFPDGQVRDIQPVLLSVIADAPEDAVLSCFRYGVKSAFPCPRCFIEKEDLGYTEPNRDIHRTVDELLEMYSQVPLLSTQGRRNHHLQILSFKLPKSCLLSRYDLNYPTVTSVLLVL